MAIAIELPISTLIMLRAIMAIADKQGEDLASIETRLECLSVFALGSPTEEDDAAESGYYAMRLMLAKAMKEAAKYIAERGLAEEGAPILVKLITKIAARFSIVISEKVAGELVPLISGVTAAGLNYIFIDHFQSVANAHFTIKRLERIYGKKVIEEAYHKL